MVRHVETTLARSLYNCDESAVYSACALAFRDRLILEWNRTQQRQTFADSKRVYYLSLEFLMGRALDNAMLNVGQKDLAKSGLADLGFRIEDVIQQEHDAALGNGGLGRLAACFLDSLASLNYPAWGYGLRYRYGIFKQEIIDGYQVEVPDYWLDFNPWEFPRHDVTVDVSAFSSADTQQLAQGPTLANTRARARSNSTAAFPSPPMTPARRCAPGRAARQSEPSPTTCPSPATTRRPRTT